MNKLVDFYIRGADGGLYYIGLDGVISPVEENDNNQELDAQINAISEIETSGNYQSAFITGRTAPAGEAFLTGRTAPAGEAFLTGRTAPAGEAFLTGRTAPAGEAFLTGRTAPAGETVSLKDIISLN